MPWEYESQESVSTTFSSPPKLSLVFLSVDRITEKMFPISFEKLCEKKEGKLLVFL